MNQIQSFDTTRLTNGEHFTFMSDTVKRVSANTVVSEQTQSQKLALEKKLAAEDEAFKLSQKNPKTDQITQADALRDGYYTGYKQSVKGFLVMPEGELLTAAQTLWQSIKDYNISVRDKLADETGKLTNLVSDLEGKLAAEVAKLNLGVFVEKLKEANNNVATLMYDRTTEDSARVAGALKTARAETDEAYKSLVTQVNALCVVSYDDAIDQFITEMNEQIDKMRKEATTRKKSGEPATEQ